MTPFDRDLFPLQLDRSGSASADWNHAEGPVAMHRLVLLGLAPVTCLPCLCDAEHLPPIKIFGGGAHSASLRQPGHLG